MRLSSPSLIALGVSLAAIALSGCNLATTAGPSTYAGAAFRGTVHGGQNPLSGAKVYLYAASSNPLFNYTQSNTTLAGATGVALDSAQNLYVTTNTSGGEILEYTAASGYTSSSIVGGLSGLDYVANLAIDPIGDIFYEDYNAGNVKELTAVSGSIPNGVTPRELTDGTTNLLRNLYGMVLDPSGNLYIAYAGQSQVIELVAVGGVIPTHSTQVVLASGLGNDSGIARDAAGDLFVSNTNGAVKEIVAVGGSIPASPTIQTITPSITGTIGLTFDAKGNLYIGSNGNVYQVVAVNGTLPANPTINTVGTGFNNPFADVVDSSGDIFVTDNSNNRFTRLTRSTPAATSANSILTAASGTTADTSGNYYATTDANGNFAIGGDYTCTQGQPVYLYTSGGNPGAGINTGASLMSVLGVCPAAGNFATTVPFVLINEITTVAAAYAMAGFAYDATHVYYSGSALGLTGIQNAFANAGNLATLQNGFATSTTMGGNGTPPTATVITLANMIASCVNSLTGSTNCTTLFNDTPDSAAFGGVTATDTATAAIHLAHNPYPGATQMTALYNLSTPTPPFGGGLSAQPNDFTLGISFTGGGLNVSHGIAIDSLGNAWIANLGVSDNGSVTKLSPLGTALSPSSGFTGGGVTSATALAVDTANNIWISNYDFKKLAKFSNAGTPISSTGYTDPNYNHPTLGVAIDSANNVYVSSVNAVLEFTSSSSYASTNFWHPPAMSTSWGLTPAAGNPGNIWVANQQDGTQLLNTATGASIYSSDSSTCGKNQPISVAVDSLGNVWSVSNQFTNVYKFNSSAVPLYSTSGCSGSSVTNSVGYSGGGLSTPLWIAIDGSGSAWVANSGNNSVSSFTNAGVALSGSNGFTGGSMSTPYNLAIDQSGNVWVTNTSTNAVTEIIGAATPVSVPFSTAAGNNTLGARP